ncbi:unnamed protein product [Arctia plantaginis]|uniref:Uncharacterized protein n=1 Tax=Arctia plantaginis TaxID=874455 RepID=A0A8S1BIG7_ARCPL|nr:unnamed protein product [Arctia plantaginis]
MAVKYDPNTLWVALNEFGDGNIFQVYPKMLAELFLQEEAARQEGDFSEAEKLVLPSDKEYRLTQYFALVALQKNLDKPETMIENDNLEEIKEDENEKPQDPAEEPPEEWAPWTLVLPLKNPHAPPPVAVKTTPGPAWDIEQVLKAARLLYKPPIAVNFTDEQDMRCVYSLIYDVFRYKIVLDQTLQDTEFFSFHPEFAVHRHLLWLFLMELARRRWGARPRNEMDRAAQLLDEIGSPFKEIENIVWEERVHFAAAIARIRIKNKAFTLSELLPAHLREERSACANRDSVTGWVNIFKAKKVALLVKRLHELGFSYSNSRQLCAGEYRFDRVCPRFITLRPPLNMSIGQLDLVKQGTIVLQEREFCEGASTLCRALRANCLQGVVAQTHASSPRCSAYLAAQLRDLAAVLKAKTPAAPATPTLGKLVVFGAGDKVESYIGALRELGIEASEAPQSGASVLILSDPVYCDTPTVISALDGVVAALATPPNSYSAVTDPIDLVCGRGGDLAMLEILTESEIDMNGKTRVQMILEEQKKTLKTLLSKPQIQLILYETHSALEAENQAQVTRAVAEANRLARERHMWLKKKHRVSSPKKHAAIAENETVTTNSTTSFDTSRSDDEKEDQSQDIPFSESQTTMQTVSTSRPTSASKHRSSRPSSRTSTARTKFSTPDRLRKRHDSLERYSRPGTTKARPIPDLPTREMPHDPDKDNPNIFVPNSDLFEVTTLPNLGNGLDINYILDRDGCYLGLIQRKEITRLDAKYMIRVAEDRGLFGPASSAPPPNRRKKEPATLSPRRRRRKQPTFEVERVAAPTYASLSRSTRRGSAPAWLEPTREPTRRESFDQRLVCERHARRHAAAAAISAAACTCDARHKNRRKSVNIPSPRLSQPACRRPFPLVVQDLRLSKSINNHHKVSAS